MNMAMSTTRYTLLWQILERPIFTVSQKQMITAIVDNGFKMMGPSAPFTVVSAQVTAKYYFSLSYPQTARLGVKVMKLGKSSIQQRVALFEKGGEYKGAACIVDIVSVVVDRESMRPCAINEEMRGRLLAGHRKGVL